MVKKTAKGTSSESEIVAKLHGTANIYADQSIDFHPDKESDRQLYTATYADTRNGSIKKSDKSIVMRVVTDANPKDLKAELLHKTLELISKVPDDGSGKLDIPDFTEHVGDTQHSKVFLKKDSIMIITDIRFDESNPKIADILAHATPEQMKYIKQYLDPDAIYQAEVATVCLLLRDCKTVHDKDLKTIHSKTRRSNKNARD